MSTPLTLAGQPQLADWLSITRLSLHIVAACVWVGGQLVVAGLLGTIRGLGESAPRRVAAAFGRLSWPAYWLLVATGIWNYLAVHSRIATTPWRIVFAVKLAVVAGAGLAAWRHPRATSPRAKGVWAGLTALLSTLALVLGVALTG